MDSNEKYENFWMGICMLFVLVVVLVLIFFLITNFTSVLIGIGAFLTLWAFCWCIYTAVAWLPVGVDKLMDKIFSEIIKIKNKYGKRN